MNVARCSRSAFERVRCAFITGSAALLAALCCACSTTEVFEGIPPEDGSSPRCGELRLPIEQAIPSRASSPQEYPPVQKARLLRYAGVSPVPYGEGPPAAVAVKVGEKSSAAQWIRPSVWTETVEQRTSWGPKVWYVVSIVLLVVTVLLAFLTFSAWVTKDDHARRLAVAAFVALGLSGLAGYWAGSNWVIDNASTSALEVEIDGAVLRLPPKSHVVARLGGAPRARVAQGGRVIEDVTLDPDGTPAQRVLRAYLGFPALHSTEPRFVYNVCGLNTYALNIELYGEL